MGEDKKPYTIHKSKEIQSDRSLNARKGLKRNLEGTSHRVESLGEWNGVEYMCDTRAVDLLATRDTFKYILKPIVWLSATTHLERDYSLLEKYVENKLKAIVTYGFHSADMEKKLKRFVAVFKAEDTLEKAVKVASALAKKGEVIVFSPSCNPKDDYINYYDRGNAFRRILENLKKQ